jgi:hypothetical protein
MRLQHRHAREASVVVGSGVAVCLASLVREAAGGAQAVRNPLASGRIRRISRRRDIFIFRKGVDESSGLMWACRCERRAEGSLVAR